jgi:hypothetical protein
LGADNDVCEGIAPRGEDGGVGGRGDGFAGASDVEASDEESLEMVSDSQDDAAGKAYLFDGVLVGKEGPATQTVVLEDASGHQPGGRLDQGSSHVFLGEGNHPHVVATDQLVIILRAVYGKLTSCRRGCTTECR